MPKKKEPAVEDLFEHAPVGYFALDQKGIIEEVNAEGKRLLGLNKSRITGQMFATFIRDKNNLDIFLKHRHSACLGHTPQTCTLLMKRGNGPDFHAELRITGRKESDTFGCLVSVSDVTAQKKAEEERERYLREMETLNDSVSRYLRAPVITLLGFAKALTEDHADKLDDEGRSNLSRIVRHAEILDHYLEDLVDFTNISLRTMTMDVIEMKSVAKSVARDLTHASTWNGLRIDVEPVPAACADMTLIRRVFECLLSNSIISTRGLEKPLITVGGYLREDENVYYVRDNGIGFDAAYSEKLFLPFQKLHSTEQFPGTGMGLAIVKKIISRHSGTVWAETEEGKETTFYFSLPAVAAANCDPTK